MALSNEDKKDVSREMGKKMAGKVETATRDAKSKAISKYPGYRKMTGAQRRNARMDRIWDEARKHGAI